MNTQASRVSIAFCHTVALTTVVAFFVSVIIAGRAIIQLMG